MTWKCFKVKNFLLIYLFFHYPAANDDVFMLGKENNYKLKNTERKQQNHKKKNIE